MTGPDVKVPTNIFYFEVLLYLSLLIDVLSAAFLDRMPDDVTESTKLAVNFIAVMMTLGFVQLVWLTGAPAQELGADDPGGGADSVVASIVTTIGRKRTAIRHIRGTYFDGTDGARPVVLIHRRCQGLVPAAGIGALSAPMLLRMSPESCKLQPWNGLTKALFWACGGMANPAPSSNC